MSSNTEKLIDATVTHHHTTLHDQTRACP